MCQPYHVCQISFLKPLFRILEDSGVDTESLVDKSGLRYFDLTRSEGYVPLESAYDFYIKSKHLIGNGCFKSANLKYYDLSRLGKFGNYLIKLPTLYSILYQFVMYKSIYQTNMNCHLSIYGDTAKFSFSSTDHFSAGRKIGEHIFMAVLLQLFQRFTDNNNQLKEIHVPYNAGGAIGAMSSHKKCRLVLGQTSFAIIFPRELLLKASKVSIRFTEQMLPGVPDFSVATTIEQVLRSFKTGYIPALSDLAQHFNVSESSIKRSLKSEDAKFSKILEKILFEKSIDLLIGTDLSVMLVSETLGYSDSPNFIRSFKKWSGLTPGHFRRNYYSIRYDNALAS